MTLITLRELNQDFLAESTSPKRKTGNESKKASVPEFDNSGVEVAKEAQITGESRAKVSCQRSERAVDGNKRLTFALISDIIFYLAVILILLYVFISGVDSGVPKTFFGYSYFSVASRSMQEEIPKGSFILVHRTKDLHLGDTITYMRDSTTSVTHKIITVYENYRNSGARGYQTQGIHNTYPDDAIVYDANVIGKVVLVIPGMGAAITFLGDNIHLVLLIYGLAVALSFLIRGFYVKPRRVID